MPTNTNGGTTTSFSNTPQAKDDTLGTASNGVLITEDSTIVILDVMSNDLGGNAKSLWSLDDASSASTATKNYAPADLLAQDTARSASTSTDFSAMGARIWITSDGKVGYDTGTMSAVAKASLQALAVGESLTDSFTYAIRLGNGTLSWATSNVVFTGSNDGPTITSLAQAGAVTEDAPDTPSPTDSLSATGTVSFNDVDLSDSHTASFAAAAGNATSLGTFALAAVDELANAADGSVNWTYNLDNAAAQYLYQGQVVTETFIVTIDDGHGATTSQNVVITITGTNDSPVITTETGANEGSAVEAGNLDDGTVVAGDPDASGTLSSSDVDTGATATWSGNASGTYGSFAIDASTGAWTYVLINTDADTDALAEGASVTDTFIATVTDDFGATATQLVTVTITGTNDAPVITGGATSGSVIEDSVGVATGQLTAFDVDDGAPQFWSVEGGTPSGSADYHFLMDSFTVTKNGNPFFQDDFNDGVPPPDGPNDEPTYVGIGSASFTESGGKLHFTDEDAVSFVGVGASDPFIGENAILRSNINPANLNPGTAGGLKSNSSFTVSGVFDLVLPDSPREQYGIRLTDRLVGGGGTPPDQLGDNAVDLRIIERTNGTLVVGLRNFNFVDDTVTGLQSIALAPPVNADQIRLNLAHSTAHVGEVTAWFDYLFGGSVIGTQAFSAVGQIFQGENWVRAEFIASAPAINDSALGGTYGTLNVDQTGTWTYSLDDSRAATQALAQGQHAIDTFTVQVADEHGAFDTTTVSIDVVGTNDAPIMHTGPVSRGLTEDLNVASGNLVATGESQFSDVDLTDTHTLVASLNSATLSGGGALPVGLSALLNNAVSMTLLDPATGDGHAQLRWDFALANSATQFLAAGQTLSLVYNLTADDQHGGTATQNVTVTVTGTNDSPVITSAVGANEGSAVEAGNLDDGSVAAGNPNASGTLSSSDVDTGATATWSGDANGTYGSFAIEASTGAWTYVLNNTDADTDALAEGASETDTFIATVTDDFGATATQQVTITVTGTNDGPVAVDDAYGGAGASATLADAGSNNTIADAQTVGTGMFGLSANAEVGNSTTVPWMRVTGLIGPDSGGANDVDMYAVQIAAGGTLTLDIDYGMFDLDPVLHVFAADGTALAINDDGHAGDAGSFHGYDSFLSYTAASTGTYYVSVSAYANFAFGGAGSFSNQGFYNNGDYVLNMSLSNAPMALSEDALLSEGSVLDNDTDVDDGAVLTVASSDATSAMGAAVTMGADGNFSYDPTAAGLIQALAAGVAATDTFSYVVTDEHGATDTAEVSISLRGVNDGPVAVADTDVGTENQSLLIDVLANDTDVDDGHSFTLTAVSVAANSGSVLISSNQLEFNPGTDFDHLNVGDTATVVVSYEMTDEHGAPSSSTATITVNGTNDGPVAVADTDAGTENQSLLIDILANDTDVDDGHSFTLTGVSVAAGNGSVSISGNQLAFNPGTDFDHLNVGDTATVVVSYDMTDEHGAPSSSTATITITGTNDAPSITGVVTGSVREDVTTSATGQLNANDVDDGAQDNWSVVGGTTAHVADYRFLVDNLKIVKNSGTIFEDTFNDGVAPPSSPNFSNGGPPHTYGVTGAFTETGGRVIMDGSAAVPIIGVGTPDPFVGHFATVRSNIDPGSTLGLKISEDFTVEGRFDLAIPDDRREAYGIRLSDRLVGGPGTPPDQAGDDGIELVVRRSTDGIVRVQVIETDVFNDVRTIVQSRNLTPTALDDQIVLRLVHDNANPGQLSAAFDLLDGGVVTSTTSFNLTGLTASQIFGTETPGNTSDDEVWTRAQIVAYAPEVADSTLNGIYGSLVVNQAGQWTYNLNNGAANVQALAQGQTVTDTFTVQVADEYGASDTQTVTVTVTGTNDGPVAGDDSAQTLEDVAVGGNVLGNDDDVDASDILTVSSAGTFATAHGSVTIGANGAYTYTPTANYSGADSFGYTISDGHGGSDTAVVSLAIEADADAPTLSVPVSNLSFELGNFTNWATTGSVGLAGSHDGYVPTDATLMAMLSNSWVGQGGLESFLGLAGGALSGMAGGGVYTNVTEGSAIRTTLAVSAGDVVTFNWDFIAHDYVPYGDFSFVAINGVAQRLAGISDVGSYGQTGWKTYSYTAATSGTLSLGAGTVDTGDTGVDSHLLLDNLRINGSAAAASGNEDTAIALAIGSALVDTDGSESLSIAISGVPAGASLSAGTNNGGGTWTLTPAQLAGLTITPALNYNGTFTLTVTATSTEASNGDQASSTKSFAVQVNPVNDAPVAEDGRTVQIVEGGVVPIGIAAPTDVDGDALSVTINALPTNGTITLSGGAAVGVGQALSVADLGGLKFAAAANANNSSSSFGYTVFDGHGGQDSTSVAISTHDSSTVGPQQVLTFDDLGLGQLIPTGYGGFDWFSITTDYSGNDIAAYNYGNSLSSPNVAIPWFGPQDTAIARLGGEDFTFVGAYFARQWTVSDITLTGIRDGLVVGSSTYYIGNYDGYLPFTWVAPNFGPIDRLNIHSHINGDSWWRMDNFTFQTGGINNLALNGGSGSDVLVGGNGNDVLTGGLGNDHLIGGPGADRFDYNNISDGTDTIMDFKRVEGDKLDIHDVLSSFSGYNGTNAFTGGFLQFTPSGADTLVQVDSDGGGNSFSTLATLTNSLLLQTDTANYVL